MRFTNEAIRNGLHKRLFLWKGNEVREFTGISGEWVTVLSEIAHKSGGWSCCEYELQLADGVKPILVVPHFQDRQIFGREILGNRDAIRQALQVEGLPDDALDAFLATHLPKDWYADHLRIAADRLQGTEVWLESQDIRAVIHNGEVVGIFCPARPQEFAGLTILQETPDYRVRVSLAAGTTLKPIPPNYYNDDFDSRQTLARYGVQDTLALGWFYNCGTGQFFKV